MTGQADRSDNVPNPLKNNDKPPAKKICLCPEPVPQHKLTGHWMCNSCDKFYMPQHGSVINEYYAWDDAQKLLVPAFEVEKYRCLESPSPRYYFRPDGTEAPDVTHICDCNVPSIYMDTDHITGEKKRACKACGLWWMYELGSIVPEGLLYDTKTKKLSLDITKDLADDAISETGDDES